MSLAEASGRQNGHDSIASFCSLTACTPEQAKFYLEANDGQFDHAVGMYYDEEQRNEHEDADSDNDADYEGSGAGPSAQLRDPQQSNERRQVGRFNPFHILQRGLQIAIQTVQYTTSAAYLVTRRLLPQSLFHSLQGSLGRLSRGSEEPNLAASQFIQRFHQQFGETKPNWQTSSWADSSRLAHGQHKLLYVYLHSPHHQDTERFCRETLCDGDFVQYVNATFVCWAGDITAPDAYRLSQSLRATSYPYNALLAFSGSRIRLIAAAEGALPPRQLQSLLQEAQERQSADLMAEQAEQNEQDRSRRLREEQDAEYHRSLEADRERERQREEAERKKASAKEAAEQAAAEERASKERIEQKAADRFSVLRNRRAAKAAQLGKEPPQGIANSIHIRVRLPDGRNFQRRFLASDPLQKAYDFVDSLDALDLLKYNLATSYPRRVFTDDTLNQTFDELGLRAQAALFVQSLDD